VGQILMLVKVELHEDKWDTTLT